MKIKAQGSEQLKKSVSSILTIFANKIYPLSEMLNSVMCVLDWGRMCKMCVRAKRKKIGHK